MGEIQVYLQIMHFRTLAGKFARDAQITQVATKIQATFQIVGEIGSARKSVG